MFSHIPSGAFLLLVTLFNLQGTGAVLADSFDRLPHLSKFVKHFFQSFPNFSDVLSFLTFQPAVLADSFNRLPHQTLFVKHFFRFFQKRSICSSIGLFCHCFQRKLGYNIKSFTESQVLSCIFSIPKNRFS